MKTDYSRLKKAGTFCGTIKAAKVKRRDRDDLARHSAPCTGYRVIPIGVVDSMEVSERARSYRPRVQRWTTARAGGKTGLAPYGWYVAEHSAGQYSRRCTYHMINYTPVVSSYGYSTATRLVATIWDKRYRYRAPRGWVFGQDSLGIYIIRTREKRENYRYHLSSADVCGGLSAMREMANRHEVGQREATKRARLQRRMDRVEDAELARYGVWVTVADSRNAGNCDSGTKTWALQHGLDPCKRYPMSVIERLAATHPAVSRVLDVARYRTREELAQGFCLI